MVEYLTSERTNPNSICEVKSVPDYENLQYYFSFGELGLENNRIQFPKTIFFDEQSSKIYITEGRPAARISVYTNNGYLITSFKHHKMIYPWGITNNEDNIYVTDTHADSVFLFMQDGMSCNIKKVGKFYGRGENQFSYPKSIAVCKLGNVYIADEYNHRIQVMDSNLNYLRTISDTFLRRPIDLQIRSSEIYVLCRVNRECIHVFSHGGEKLYNWKIEETANRVPKTDFFCMDARNNILMNDKNDLHIYTRQGKHLQCQIQFDSTPEDSLQSQGITISNDLRLMSISLCTKYGVKVFL